MAPDEELVEQINAMPMPLRSSLWVYESLRLEAPNFVEAAEAALDLRVMNNAVAEGSSSSIHRQALVELNNNATNDWLDLVMDAMSGRGRSVLRSARSLFEISLVAGDLLSDEQLAERFLAHRAVVMSRFLDLDEDRGRRGRVQGRRAEHGRKRAQRHWKAEADAAIAKYGSPFGRGWDLRTVRDRAALAGRLPEYLAYQVASATVHGGSGAVIGTLRMYGPESPVHRLGPNVAVTPMALLYGALSFRRYLEALSGAGIAAATGLIDRVDTVLRWWASFERALDRVDRRIWPGHAPERFRLIAIVEPSDIVAFYLHDPERSVAIRANANEGSAWVHQRVGELVDRLRHAMPVRSSSLSIVLPSAEGTPRPGAEWVDAHAVIPDARTHPMPHIPGAQVRSADGWLFDVNDDGVPIVVRHVTDPDPGSAAGE